MNNATKAHEDPKPTRTASDVKAELKQELEQIRQSIMSQSTSTRAHLQGRFLVE